MIGVVTLDPAKRKDKIKMETLVAVELDKRNRGIMRKKSTTVGGKKSLKIVTYPVRVAGLSAVIDRTFHVEREMKKGLGTVSLSLATIETAVVHMERSKCSNSFVIAVSPVQILLSPVVIKFHLDCSLSKINHHVLPSHHPQDSYPHPTQHHLTFFSPFPSQYNLSPPPSPSSSDPLLSTPSAP